MKYSWFFPFILLIISCQSNSIEEDNEYTRWSHYGGSPDMIHYSSSTEIDTNNVSQLKPVWIYNTGDADTTNNSQIQCNPIVINEVLYGVTPQMKLFAINAKTGEHIWTFDPRSSSTFDNNKFVYHILINSRGIAYWSDGAVEERIFFTAGSYTYAVDAKSGKGIPTFGENGYIDLHKGLGRNVDALFVASTSPGVVYEDMLIMGMRVDESTPSAPGHIRGFDVRTGEQKWIFHTLPQPGEEGYETWEDTNAWKYSGGANVWSGFSLDESRGWIFCGTGSASYDFYGGKRKGENLFANCILALDAKTGERKWHFQTLHHDIWDKDIPTPPTLVTIQRDGKDIEAVAQSTKNGFLFILERETGKPLFEIEEKLVDTSSVLIGEQLHPTQPVPKLPKPFTRQTFSENDINPYLSDSAKLIVDAQIEAANYGDMFKPFSFKPTITLPGFDGGGEWGGPAYDPETNILYVNANEMAWYITMLENPKSIIKDELMIETGLRLYKKHCQSCHGEDRKGVGNNPSIVTAKERYPIDEFTALIRSGRRMMPAHNYLSSEEVLAISSFVLEIDSIKNEPYIPAKKTPEELIEDERNYMPYKIAGYKKFLAPDGMPAISPPWGTLNAINISTGETSWQVPLGEYEVYKKEGLPPTGTENYGGPIVTKGGLVFIAATVDGHMRAFHKKTGELLWEYKLPYPAFATPAMYEIDGKQYLVIACGGGKLDTKAGDAYVAFGL